ncbi:hypothetical protein A28LD_1829 [Idiomarina sp. A28L]|uniref:hypothetical protein n=1 Tax=Idiomarina sp. A28L TaxID=1036674 RepID=UPI0002138723|nr:hypothetical protein [Idiomarina sp. A28L]EGN74813.1 hypothetical protein A28LD_1829 [Idiomarina sp. A28L]
MDINGTVTGLFLFFCGVVIGLIGYCLGRRKTQTPFLAGVLGFFLGLIPIFGIIYLVILMLKNDVATNESAAHSKNDL